MEGNSTSVLLLGTNGTGKSTRLMDLAERRIKQGHRVLFIPAHEHETSFNKYPPMHIKEVDTFTGGRRIYVTNEDQFVELILKIRNLVLVCDDFRVYLPKDRTHPEVRKLFIKRRHINVDIYMAAHGFKEVPPPFFAFMDYIFLHKTLDASMNRIREFPNPKGLMEKVQEVNKAAQKDQYHCEIITRG
jgi:hypothetical protein